MAVLRLVQLCLGFRGESWADLGPGFRLPAEKAAASVHLRRSGNRGKGLQAGGLGMDQRLQPSKGGAQEVFGGQRRGSPSALGITCGCPGQGSGLQRCRDTETGRPHEEQALGTERAGWCPGRLVGRAGGAVVPTPSPSGSRLPPPEHRRSRRTVGLRTPLPGNC